MYMYVPWNLPYCDVHTVLCVGASADIADNYGRTPLKQAQFQFSTEANPEKKQRYEKVHEYTHTITHFDISNVSWKKSCTVKVQIFVVTIFRGLNSRGD